MNPQEQFWRGTFGDEYAKRSPGSVPANVALFGRILAATDGVRRVIEFGAGVGNNIVAIGELLPEAQIDAVEINAQSVGLIPVESNAFQCSMLEFDWRAHPAYDLAFTKGVLIHIAPDDLRRAYDVLWHSSRRYILLAEYYNPKPVEIEYRGHAGRLWKRDFAGEMLDIYGDLRLVDYGFVYHRDGYPQDDITWFLLSKE